MVKHNVVYSSQIKFLLTEFGKSLYGKQFESAELTDRRPSVIVIYTKNRAVGSAPFTHNVLELVVYLLNKGADHVDFTTKKQKKQK